MCTLISAMPRVQGGKGVSFPTHAFDFSVDRDMHCFQVFRYFSGLIHLFSPTRSRISPKLWPQTWTGSGMCQQQHTLSLGQQFFIFLLFSHLSGGISPEPVPQEEHRIGVEISRDGVSCQCYQVTSLQFEWCG